jgi:hypothetical protein
MMGILSKALIIAGGLVIILGFFLIDNYQPTLSVLDNVMRGSVPVIPALGDCFPQWRSDGTSIHPFCGLDVPYRFLLIAGILLVCLGAIMRRYKMA